MGDVIPLLDTPVKVKSAPWLALRPVHKSFFLCGFGVRTFRRSYETGAFQSTLPPQINPKSVPPC